MNTHRPKSRTVTCQICGEQIPISEAFPVDLVRESLLPTLKKLCPQLDHEGYISLTELNKIRILHAEELAVQDTTELGNLRKEVAQSLKNQELITKNIDHEFDQNSSRGERIADKVASFGGSWTFIIIFLSILFVWMAVNTTLILSRPFDPFPYIFLNLVLSCVAAIQAPVIMMSQNRQETKDRLRGENDYKINLKAELEIRHISEKLDKLINDQWKHLLEIQEMQMEMLQPVSSVKRSSNEETAEK